MLPGVKLSKRVDVDAPLIYQEKTWLPALPTQNFLDVDLQIDGDVSTIVEDTQSAVLEPGEEASIAVKVQQCGVFDDACSQTADEAEVCA